MSSRVIIVEMDEMCGKTFVEGATTRFSLTLGDETYVMDLCADCRAKVVKRLGNVLTKARRSRPGPKRRIPSKAGR